MTKKLKKHQDVLLIAGIGLVLVMVGILAIDIVPPISLVEAATTSATSVAVSATVAESITLTIAGVGSSEPVNGATTNVVTNATSVAFGTVEHTANKVAAHDLTVTTNATNGYTTHAKYDQQLTSGSDTIDNHTGSNVTPTTFSAAGTEAFGYTTNDATLGTGTADRFTTGGGDKWAAFEAGDKEVAYHNVPVADQIIRVGYQIGIANITAAGTYTNTVTYTAIGSF